MSSLNERAPIDSKGLWFDRFAVNVAEEMYRKLRSPPRVERITPADQAQVRGHHEEAARYRAQDRERALARAQIIGDGKNPDGSPSAESICFVELCCSQIKANCNRFVGRNRAVFSEPPDWVAAPQELAELQRALGVSAKPQEERSAD